MDYDKLFSKPRMSTYRKLASNEHHAQRLYQWNIDISSALYESLVLIEIPLRNTMDNSLKLINQTFPDTDGTLHSSDWTKDPNSLISSIIPTFTISKVKNHLNVKPELITHDDIVAQLTFGTWRYIFPSREDHRKILLWEQGLNTAFSLKDYSQKQLTTDVKRLHIARNRVAHAEPLLQAKFTTNVMKSLYRVAGSIDPKLERYIKSTQRVTRVNKLRPR
ncbi:MAG: Abi family protein [Lactobacillaceae bacterium]|jgi:hypothetical protein|nr:Abi family protein [Lactobacillaceae bacterium]